MLTNDDMLQALRDAIGTQKPSQWCRDNGVDQGYVCGVLSGARPIGGKLLVILGYQKKVHFVKIDALLQSREVQ